jgi:MATE family multidrug resistance protein
MWGMAVATFLWIRASPDLSRHLTWGPIEAATLRQLLTLGWPMAITYAVEALLFLSAALMMGTLGVTALAAHQVAINVASVTFMVPLAVSQAANVRVAFHVGARAPRAARTAGGTAFVLGVGFMALAAIVMYLAPEEIARLFQLDPADPADAPVVAQIVSLMVVAAFFQVFDGAQVIALGALRGLQDTRVPMWIAGTSYWLIGFPAAWLLGFTLGGGPPGIWWGLALGLLVVAIALSIRFERMSTHVIAVSGAAAASA